MTELISNGLMQFKSEENKRKPILMHFSTLTSILTQAWQYSYGMFKFLV